MQLMWMRIRMRSRSRDVSGIVAVVVAALATAAVRGDEFEYGNQASWYDTYEQCSMSRQSPIELNSMEAEVSYDIPALSFVYYDTPFSSPAPATNNGHTANIQLPKPKGYIADLWQVYDKLSPHVSGGPLPYGRFVADSVHFHWGSKDSHGSEHVIDSERFSMEMHVLHRNSKYRSVEEAREHEDGLAVLAVLFSVQSMISGFSGLEEVIGALESIGEYNKTTEIEGFTLDTLFGDLDRAEFYTYQGSLTTPPCSQAVTWVVFSHVIPVSHLQMNRFHKLADTHGATLENNYRSLQAKGNRKVYLRQKRKILDSIIESPIFWDLISKLHPEPLEAQQQEQQSQPTADAVKDLLTAAKSANPI